MMKKTLISVIGFLLITVLGFVPASYGQSYDAYQGTVKLNLTWYGMDAGKGKIKPSFSDVELRVYSSDEGVYFSSPAGTPHIEGEGEIEIGDGTKRRFKAGDILLAEDTTGRGHITRVLNNQPRKVMFVTLD